MADTYFKLITALENSAAPTENGVLMGINGPYGCAWFPVDVETKTGKICGLDFGGVIFRAYADGEPYFYQTPVCIPFNDLSEIDQLAVLAAGKKILDLL